METEGPGMGPINSVLEELANLRSELMVRDGIVIWLLARMASVSAGLDPEELIKEASGKRVKIFSTIEISEEPPPPKE